MLAASLISATLGLTLSPAVEPRLAATRARPAVGVTMMATKVFIDGEAGTTGLQVRGRLEKRSDVELIALPEALRKDAAARKEAINAADAVILCLPDAAAIEAAALVDPANERTVVIDASTAHRVDPAWAYGFPELSDAQRAQIAGAKRISNPGCYATGFIALVSAPPTTRPRSLQRRALARGSRPTSVPAAGQPARIGWAAQKGRSPRHECHIWLLGWRQAAHGSLRGTGPARAVGSIRELRLCSPRQRDSRGLRLPTSQRLIARALAYATLRCPCPQAFNLDHKHLPEMRLYSGLESP
jgi:hypothetical protein